MLWYFVQKGPLFENQLTPFFQVWSESKNFNHQIPDLLRKDVEGAYCENNVQIYSDFWENLRIYQTKLKFG